MNMSYYQTELYVSRHTISIIAAPKFFKANCNHCGIAICPPEDAQSATGIMAFIRKEAPQIFVGENQ